DRGFRPQHRATPAQPRHVVCAIGYERGRSDERPRALLTGRKIDQRLVWRVRRPHHSCRESEMQASEPKPHEINKLLVSFDSEVRKGGCRRMMRISESGHWC